MTKTHPVGSVRNILNVWIAPNSTTKTANGMMRLSNASVPKAKAFAAADYRRALFGGVPDERPPFCTRKTERELPGSDKFARMTRLEDSKGRYDDPTRIGFEEG